MSYERDNIKRLTAYTPGEQPRAAKIIKLNTNENPYQPVDAIMNALRGIEGEQLRKYPPATAQGFREAAAHAHNVHSSQIIATNGSDELLRLAITCYCDPTGETGKGGIGITDPTYSLYNVLAAIQDTPITTVPLDENYAMPADIAQKWNDAGCTLAMIVNPHAPSGRFYEIEEIKEIAKTFKGILIVDEAYTDFAETSALELVYENSGIDNVLISRTLSKGYSLAGLRFGYGIGHKAIIETLDKARDSYNTDFVSQALATAAIEARDEVAKSWEKVVVERGRMRKALEGMGYKVFPSQTNFLLAVPPADGPNAQTIYEKLAEKLIFIRYFSAHNMNDKIRISMGTAEQNDALLGALEEIK